MRQDRIKLYYDMVDVIGQMRMRSGLNKNDNHFFLSKKKVYSRALLRIAPHLGVQPKNDTLAPVEPKKKRDKS